MWPTVKKNYEFVKSVDPQLKTWLCLNDVKGVRALEGFTDMWDVYIRQFDQSGVAQNLEAGQPVIWGLCVYPHEHPNLFIEYPAMDARIVGWLTYVYGVSGFEYWGLNQWGPNTAVKIGRHSIRVARTRPGSAPAGLWAMAGCSIPDRMESRSRPCVLKTCATVLKTPN